MKHYEEQIIEDTLSPYERYQLEHYGNVLNNANPMDQFKTADKEKISTAEEAFLFTKENPE